MSYRVPNSTPSPDAGTNTSSFTSSSSCRFPSGAVCRPMGVLSSPSSQYMIQSVLGEGTFGKVVKCLKMATNRTVAVKIAKEKDLTPEAKNEMEIMEELRAFDSDRFNFVTFNDVFVSGGHVCLELEILDMSLFEFLYQKPRRSLELDEIRPILYQVSVTLQLLQSLGVVHTDLKPENIMLLDHRKQPWRIKVIDFGVACHAATSELGDYMQTQNYRSPEIILGFPITSAIDMWSLGCITAELFTGAVLYPGDTDHEMLQHIVQTQGHPPARLMYRGVKTRWFFNCRRKDGRRRWRLKQCGETNTSAGQFNSLDDIITLKPARHLLDEDTAAETEDRREFLDLLKKTLHLDIDRRISPSELLQHPFITLNHLAQNHQNGFYVKSSCEKMEVCLDQSGGFDGGQMTPSISGAEGPPAWFRTREHPLILGISSQVSTAAPPCQPERTGRKALRKSSRRNPRCDCRKQINSSPESKKRKLDDSEEAERKRGRKRTWDTFLASHIESKNERSGSPERKKRKLDDFEAERKRGTKRTWDTFVASGLRNERSGSPERKKRKTSLEEEETNTQGSSLSTGKRKRRPGDPPEGEEEPRCVKRRRY
ncbi:hypothetical protein CgunFtcFv8_018922 [Champsocephalus gunnari]|uniref:Protein kinase domain-containing protein n=1 Tax=Champsocephalus gunnari TaxID=52237 RepID=A0AAN8DGT8_CHAGU|nr:hypothetical protein CgunFtcFv8_018922 [Champsocephalus gunnari]